MGLGGGLNVYGFASGDPVDFSDPFGLQPCPPDNDCGWSGADAAAVFAQLDRMRPAMAQTIEIGTAVAAAPIVAGIAAEAAAGSGGAEGVSTFYRAVGEQEAKDIADKGALRTVGKSAEGKYLTNTIEAAKKWGQMLHGEAAKIAEVRVPQAAAKAFDYLGRIDGAGEAWFARMEQLKDAVVRILPK